MGFFSRIGQFLHGVVDAGFRAIRGAVSHVWQRWVRPAVESVAGWFGFRSEQTQAACDGVENAASQIADVLQMEVAQLVDRALKQADTVVESWKARYLGDWQDQLTERVSQIRAASQPTVLRAKVVRRRKN